MITEANLIGYILDALDPEERRGIEELLGTSPAMVSHMEQLRRVLVPLEADREQPAPPAGLVERTLAHVLATDPAAATRPMAVPALPRAPRDQPEARSMGGRMRPDMIIAFGISFFACGLLLSAMNNIRVKNEIVACQSNLHTLYTGLEGYADTHGGKYPMVGTSENPTADSFYSLLADAGQVPADFRPACPSNPATLPTPGRSNPHQVGYTYTLGHRNADGALQGTCRSSDKEHDLIPISADYPTAAASPMNGPLTRHPKGMNILNADGSVHHSSTHLIGAHHDDIFLNAQKRVAAGIGPDDVVLGRPGDTP